MSSLVKPKQKSFFYMSARRLFLLASTTNLAFPVWYHVADYSEIDNLFII